MALHCQNFSQGVSEKFKNNHNEMKFAVILFCILRVFWFATHTEKNYQKLLEE